ncbi:MAG: DUF6249 domain-containing protein [Caulobacteraceae bacterium]
MEGILVPITMFLVIGAVIIAPRYFKNREREALQATLRAAIERGQPLPPEVIDAISRDARPAPSSARDLRTGVIWIGIAAGLVGLAYALGYSEDAADAFWPLIGTACLPGFIGLAFLVMAGLNRGKGKV